MTITRRSLLQTATLGTMAAATAFAAACTVDGDPMDGSGGGGSGGNSGCSASTISGNHGHTLNVTTDQVAAGTDMTFSIQGSSGHDHEITITTADFMLLTPGGTITVTSTMAAGHDHQVTVSCS